MDVAIVGAGAAGLAAGRRLSERRPDLRIQVLEAQDRAGGRAHTIVPSAIGAPLDLGCGWLHGAERNPWLAIAEALGFHVDRTPAPWDVQYRDLGFPRRTSLPTRPPPRRSRRGRRRRSGIRWTAPSARSSTRTIRGTGS
ncbi:FAD-dependent oxidoreductase [Methylobacterium sp. P31]